VAPKPGKVLEKIQEDVSLDKESINEEAKEARVDNKDAQELHGDAIQEQTQGFEEKSFLV
jgi:hypothetical protein